MTLITRQAISCDCVDLFALLQTLSDFCFIFQCLLHCATIVTRPLDS